MPGFLIDASLPRPAAQVVRTYGHVADDVRELAMGAANDRRIAAYAQSHALCLLTRDGDFGNVLDYPPANYAGIVVIETPVHGSRALVLNLLAAFMESLPMLEPLSGKLFIVEPGHVRVRTGR